MREVKILKILLIREGLYEKNIDPLPKSQQCPGVLCGVQTGLQSGMDLLKFLLVIALPHQDTFGILIIASFLVSNVFMNRYKVNMWVLQFISGGGLFFLRFCVNKNKSEMETPLLLK